MPLTPPSPYSDNIIFMDGEFSTLDVRVGELISVGLVKNNGEELYLEIEYSGFLDPWVEKNVIPQFLGGAVSRGEACTKMRAFVGDSKPYLVAYVNQFDAIYWYKLFNSPKEHPVFWIPIDFASLLFAYGFDPESFNDNHFFELLGVDKKAFGLHNALEDARLLAVVYKNFFEYINKNRAAAL